LLKAADQATEPRVARDIDDGVQWLQEALNDLGADPKIVVDGRYGPATRRAVKRFQAAAGIRADGIAGPITKAAIRLRLDAIRRVATEA
jgi:putative chitinase